MRLVFALHSFKHCQNFGPGGHFADIELRVNLDRRRIAGRLSGCFPANPRAKPRGGPARFGHCLAAQRLLKRLRWQCGSPARPGAAGSVPSGRPPKPHRRPCQTPREDFRLHPRWALTGAAGPDSVTGRTLCTETEMPVQLPVQLVQKVRLPVLCVWPFLSIFMIFMIGGGDLCTRPSTTTWRPSRTRCSWEEHPQEY